MPRYRHVPSHCQLATHRRSSWRECHEPYPGWRAPSHPGPFTQRVPSGILPGGRQAQPATKGTNRMDLKPAEFVQEENLWSLRRVTRMQPLPSSFSSSSGVTTPLGSTPAVTHGRIRRLPTEADSVKEIRLYRLGEHFVKQFRDLSDRFYRADSHLIKKEAQVQMPYLFDQRRLGWRANRCHRADHCCPSDRIACGLYAGHRGGPELR